MRGLAYRSDTFNPMSTEDIKKLERIGLKSDYDLRTTAEIEAKPDQMPAGVRYRLLNVLADAKSAAPAELEALLHEPKKANVVLGGGRIEAPYHRGLSKTRFSRAGSLIDRIAALVPPQMRCRHCFGALA